MRKMLGATAILSLAACATLQKAEPKDPMLKTIGFPTGNYVDDEVYGSQFRMGAETACGGKNYTLVERSRRPATLEGIVLPSTMFYWVVRCGRP